MKKVYMVIVIVTFLTGFGFSSNEPLKLEFGRSIDDIPFIKEGMCDTEDELVTCIFRNQSPFDKDSDKNALKFYNGKLIGVYQSYFGGNDLDSVCALLAQKGKNIFSLVKDKKILLTGINNCKNLEKIEIENEDNTFVFSELEGIEAKEGNIEISYSHQPYYLYISRTTYDTY
ncbi:MULTISPECIES: hypothetical protein [Gammaproteobacteria]|uniref:hypothetical protein n=1 Tax=Gammaproteobacteria TaxID=1236 RepID=UPI001866048C|nr:MULTISPECIES: hypothetical protein [Gammaproteobacteria]